jgi:hypothetical protein
MSGADFEEQNFVHLVADGAHNDDGGRGAGRAQPAADLRPVHAGEPEIDQREVGLEQQRFLVAFVAVGNLDGAKALAFEHDPDGVTQALVVIDYQNGLHPRAALPCIL